MPACRDCKWVSIETKTCRIGAAKPLRNCVVAIMLEYAELLKPGERVLEIGCGAWSPLREQSRTIGCRWYGIDINADYRGKPTIATAQASVSEIPYRSETFDYVIATQSMGLWESYQVNLQKGLSEVFRVLKPGGSALINVPIYFNGGYRFMQGDVDGIVKLFEPFSEDIALERWRMPPDPLPPHQILKRAYWHKPSIRNQSSYVLDIRARRRVHVPYFNYPPLGLRDKIEAAIRYRGLPYYLRFVGVPFQQAVTAVSEVRKRR